MTASRTSIRVLLFGPLAQRAGQRAVNGRFALEDEVVTPEDEVALIGMVSGG